MMVHNKTLGIFTVKKIAFYNNEYYTYGGFGSYLSEMRKYFKKTILVAHVTKQAPREGYYKIPTDNLEIVHLLQSRNELENLVQQPFNFFIARKRMCDMDIVHCRMPDYTGIIGVILSRMYKKQFFIQTIADWRIEAKKMPVSKKYGLGLFLKLDYYLYDFLERKLAKNRLVFAQGTSSYEKHKNKAETKLISSTAHYNKDIGILRKRFTDKKKVKVLHVGRLTGIKNQELIIDTIATLNKETEIQWELSILGEGPLRKKLQHQIDELCQTKNIQLIGQVDRGDIFWNYFDTADLFIMSSRSEGTPKVVLEAMARSVPVVASNVGGIPYLVKDKTRGLLFEDNNKQALMDAILFLQKEEIDRDKMMQNAFEFSKNNTVEKSTEFMVTEVSRYFQWEEE